MAATSTMTLGSPSPSERLQGGTAWWGAACGQRCVLHGGVLVTPQRVAMLFVASGSDSHTGKTKLKSNPVSPSARRTQQDSPFILLSW